MLLALPRLGSELCHGHGRYHDALKSVQQRVIDWATAYTYHERDPRVPPNVPISPTNSSIVPRTLAARSSGLRNRQILDNYYVTTYRHPSQESSKTSAWNRNSNVVLVVTQWLRRREERQTDDHPILKNSEVNWMEVSFGKMREWTAEQNQKQFVLRLGKWIKNADLE
jgi:hypothetical protein